MLTKLGTQFKVYLLFSIVSYNRFVNVKAVVSVFNQEKALVGASSVITNLLSCGPSSRALPCVPSPPLLGPAAGGQPHHPRRRPRHRRGGQSGDPGVHHQEQQPRPQDSLDAG